MVGRAPCRQSPPVRHLWHAASRLRTERRLRRLGLAHRRRRATRRMRWPRLHLALALFFPGADSFPALTLDCSKCSSLFTVSLTGLGSATDFTDADRADVLVAVARLAGLHWLPTDARLELSATSSYSSVDIAHLPAARSLGMVTARAIFPLFDDQSSAAFARLGGIVEQPRIRATLTALLVEYRMRIKSERTKF